MLIDIILIAVCLYVPYLFRYNRNLLSLLFQGQLGESLLLPEISQHSLVFLFWGILIILFFRMYNIYTTERTISYLEEAIMAGKGIIMALLPAAAAVFFLQIKIFSREVFIFQTSLLFITLIGWRVLKRYLVRRRVARGFNNQHVLIVGAGKVGKRLAAEIAQNRYLG